MNENARLSLNLRRPLSRAVWLSLIQLTFFRLLGLLFGVVGSVLITIGNGFNQASNAIFAIECDGARKYEALTGVRLGFALGQIGRYTDLHEPDSETHPNSTVLGVSEFDDE